LSLTLPSLTNAYTLSLYHVAHALSPPPDLTAEGTPTWVSTDMRDVRAGNDPAVDMVGVSAVPEVIVAREVRIRVGVESEWECGGDDGGWGISRQRLGLRWLLDLVLGTTHFSVGRKGT
jgi:hypothetical protein